MASTNEILGRQEVDDLEAILAVTNTDVNEIQHLVQSNGDAIFTWDYDRSRPALGKLYERAKKSQWNAQTDLPWDTDVDQEHVVLNNALANNMTFGPELDTKGTPFEKWGDAEWLAFGVQSQNWTLSQFLHGEQGALICTAKVVETVPWIDAKYYAATQVMDEARHVAFGVLSLQEYYQQLSASELRERQEFAFEAAVRMRDRFLQQEVWDHFGVDVKEAVKIVMQAPERATFQALLFSKIGPNCKKLGLLDAGDGWLRERFTELGVIQFEDWVDTGEEYERLDAIGEAPAA